jgi:hypothetical protein
LPTAFLLRAKFPLRYDCPAMVASARSADKKRTSQSAEDD